MNRAAADSVARHIRRELSADANARATADIAAMCRASTDVVVAEVHTFPGRRRMEAVTSYSIGASPEIARIGISRRLWSRAQPSSAARADSAFMRLPYGSSVLGEELIVGPTDTRLIRCRVQYPLDGLVPGWPAGRNPT